MSKTLKQHEDEYPHIPKYLIPVILGIIVFGFLAYQILNMDTASIKTEVLKQLYTLDFNFFKVMAVFILGICLEAMIAVSTNRWKNFKEALFGGLIGGLIGGLFVGLFAGLFAGLFWGLFWGLFGILLNGEDE